MSKLLVERNIFQKLLDTFFKAKADGKEDKFKNGLKKQSPDLGHWFDEYDAQLVKNAENMRQIAIRNGLDTTEVDNYLRQYGK